jgi:hypothetical protein
MQNGTFHAEAPGANWARQMHADPEWKEPKIGQRCNRMVAWLASPGNDRGNFYEYLETLPSSTSSITCLMANAVPAGVKEIG